MLELRALGNAEIETDTATLTPSREIVFAAALYLILERGRRTTRSGLAELLWPKVDTATRSHRLRQTLLQLKRLGFPVCADNYTVRIAPNVDSIEIRAFLELEKGFPERESIEFLPGYTPRFSEPFRDWVDSKRSEFNGRTVRALLPILREKRAGGKWADVEAIARRSLLLEPLNESAVLALAESCAMRGQKHEAVSIIDAYLGEIGSSHAEIRLPATLLRRRISDRPEESSQASTEPAFLGRDKELELLIKYLRRAEGGTGIACTITGEPGIGKSRLASELCKFAQLQGLKVHRVTCRRSDVERPLSVFVDLVPQLRELPGAIGCSQETMIALKRLTEFDGAGIEKTRAFDELASLYLSVRHALFDLLDAIAEEQCLLILVEDVHWLDRASAKIISEIIDWAGNRKLLLLLNARLESGALGDIDFPQTLKEIKLAPLERNYAQRLLEPLVSARIPHPDSGVLEWIVSAGEGNPFFLQELAKHWVETGHHHDVPPSVATILNSRLLTLSRESLHVLQSCAVLSQHATLDRIEAVLEYKSHQLLSAVQELSSAALVFPIECETVNDDGHLRIRHDLVSSAALRLLAPTALAYLHRRSGTVLEREIAKAKSRTSLLWAAAFHWGNAGDSRRALAVAQSCAEHLLEIGLPSDSVAAFQRACDYCTTDDEKLAVHSRLVVALQMNGQWEKSKEVLLSCRDLRRRCAPNENVHDELEVHLYDARWRASLEDSSLLRDLIACVKSFKAPPSHRVSCALLGLKVGSELGAIDEMRNLYREIEPLLIAGHGDPKSRLEIGMVFHSICGDLTRALNDLDRYLAIVRVQKNPLAVCRGLGNAALACRLAGRKDDAARLVSEAVDHALANKLTTLAAASFLSLARLFLASGEIDNAREVLERAESFSKPTEDPHLYADCLYLAARLAFEEQDPARAALLYQTLEARVPQRQSVNRRAAVLALGVQIGIKTNLRLDSLAQIVNNLHAAHLVTRGTGSQDFEALSLFLGMRALGEHEKGAELLRQYAEVHRREKWPVPATILEAINASTTAVST